MPLYDNDRTANHAIGKLYDNDRLVNHQIGKQYDNDGTANYLIYSAAPDYLYEDGAWNTEYMTGLTNGTSFDKGTGDTSSGAGASLLSTTTPACDLSGLTGIRITGNFYIQASSHGSGSTSGSLEVKRENGEYHTLASGYAYANANVGGNNIPFDKIIYDTFSENEILTFKGSCWYGPNPTWGNGYFGVTITGIYPIE